MAFKNMALKFKLSAFSKMTLKERINMWCKDHSDKIKSNCVLEVRPFNFFYNNDYILRFRVQPKFFNCIIISPEGIVTDKYYKQAFPNYYQHLLNLWESYFEFIDIIAKYKLTPNKYPDVHNFFSDYRNEHIYKWFNNWDKNLLDALLFLIYPTFRYDNINHYYFEDVNGSIIKRHVDHIKALEKNTQLVLDIIKNYNTHPLIKLLKLQVM